MIPLVVAPISLPSKNHEVDIKEVKVTAPWKTFNWDYLDELLEHHIAGDECHFSILKDINGKPTVQKNVLKHVNAKFIFFQTGILGNLLGIRCCTNL